MAALETLAEWHESPNKAYVNANPGNIGYPVRLNAIVKQK